jgi:malonyl-CoA O-methyltransferase
LADNGCFFVSELHPFRQYQGTKANFQRNESTTEIDAFVHHTSDFTRAAFAHGLVLKDFKEWWHEEDAGKPPRLISFMFERGLLQ